MSVQLPIPPHYDPQRVDSVWRVPYEERAREAGRWAAARGISPAAGDAFRVCLLLIDLQNTFCIPGFELFVGGHSGTAAVDDNRRLCAFIYRNLGRITTICPTMDTHHLVQIFHSIFLVDADGNHPPPYTLVSAGDVARGRWRFNSRLAGSLGIDAAGGDAILRHYTRRLEAGRKYDLTVWPYHAMLGGIGHCLVAAVEEAVFFHSLARTSQPDFQLKGQSTFTENYSVLRPEVLTGPAGQPLGVRNVDLVDRVTAYDAVVIAGQAKSHCVAWTVADLLDEIRARDPRLAGKVYLLEDCTSPVVIPGAADYSEAADAAFRRFADAGMHVVRSDQPMDRWPGMAAAENPSARDGDQMPR